MGLGNSNPITYISVVDGKIARRVKEKTETSRQRTTKENKVIHEELYDHISGQLTGIEKVKHDSYGDFWNIYLEDEGKEYCLQFNYDSRYATAFLKTLPNVNLREKLTIIPNMKTVNDKKQGTVFIKQGSTVLKHYYNKTTPNGLPELKGPFTIKQKEVWDNTDQMKFLEEMVEKKIKPFLKGARKAEPESKPVFIADKKGESTDENINNPDMVDDLPF